MQQLQIDAALGSPTFVDTPAGPVATWEHGPPQAPTVVLVHGFGDAAAGWTELALMLGKTHHVVLLDLPGHGRSAPRSDMLEMAQLRAGLHTVVAAQDGPVTLVGNSLGGWLSAMEASENPDAVERVVFVNAAGLQQDVDPDLLLPDTHEGVRRKFTAIMGEHAPDAPSFVLDAFIELHGEPRLHNLFAELDRGEHHVDALLPALAPPSHLIWGTPDPFFPVDDYLERFQQALPGTPEPALLDGCGHAPQYSCPQELYTALDGALTDGG